jgi:hypothetical protein
MRLHHAAVLRQDFLSLMVAESPVITDARKLMGPVGIMKLLNDSSELYLVADS